MTGDVPEVWQRVPRAGEPARTARFISEALEPLGGAFDSATMATGEPGLPAGFRWRARELEIVRVLEKWRTTGPCHHGSGDRYVRRHMYRLLTREGLELEVYFERQARSARAAKQRWWLLSIAGEQET